MNSTDIKKDLISISSDVDYYGGSYILSKYCGFKSRPGLYKDIYWQHGWTPPHFVIHPYLVVPGEGCEDLDKIYLVARKDHKDCLKKNGYKNVYAIGLPVVYLKEVAVKRKPNSLLVMPVHSLEYTSHDHWSFVKYAEEIYKLKDQFDEISICIHPSCIKKGYWVKEFEALGFKILEGSSVNDKNALYRMQLMLSAYEHVTTNGFGSHIVYAAYFGAKVSLYGPYAEFKKEDYANDLLYARYPEILEPTIRLLSEKVLREEMSHLFVSPKNAKQQTDWAKNELGFGERAQPWKIKMILGWDFKSRLMLFIKKKLLFMKPIVLKFKPE